MGDENQLDPTVISQDKLLKETVFGKLSKKRKEYFVMLDTQYRMHP
jgi:superfamily I DNA and/or RNA helicase